MENNLKQLPERFSVYAKTLEEAKYIVKKQEELCGGNEYESRNSYYRFCPNAVYDKYGKMGDSYLGSSFDVTKEFTFEEFKSFFEKKEEFPTDDFCVTNNRNNKEVVEYLVNKGFKRNGFFGNSSAYYGVKNNQIDASFNPNSFKTSYTLQQLKELDNMKERKIIGYKCPMDLFDGKVKVGDIYVKIKTTYGLKDNSSTAFELPKEIVEQWSPVYEQKYKVGDWITVTNTSNSKWLLDTNQKTFKLTQEPTNFNGIMCWSTSGIGNRGMNKVGMYGIREEDFRKATEEEIKSVQQKTINVNNTDIIIKKGSMFAVDKEFDLNYLQVVRELFNDKIPLEGWTISVETVKIGCRGNFKKSDIENIIDEYKKFNTN